MYPDWSLWSLSSDNNEIAFLKLLSPQDAFASEPDDTQG